MARPDAQVADPETRMLEDKSATAIQPDGKNVSRWRFDRPERAHIRLAKPKITPSPTAPGHRLRHPVSV
jgi:hypothetical protein